jgi:hypothetical protein
VVDVTGEDWGRIHAKAWTDDKFRKLLETNPTEAIKTFGLDQNPPKYFDRIVIVPERPAGITDEFLPFANPFPPSCC